MTKRQKRELLILVIVVALAVVASKLLGGHFGGDVSLPEKTPQPPLVAAIVNGEEISSSTVDLCYTAALWMHDLDREDVPEDMRRPLRQNLLDMIIRDKLLAEGAEASGVSVTDEEVEQTIQEQFLPPEFSGEEEFLETVKADLGPAADSLWEMVRNLKLASKMQERLSEGIEVTEEEVDAELVAYAEALKHHPGGEVPLPPREEARDNLVRRKAELEFARWIDGLLAEADIEIVDPDLQAPIPRASTITPGEEINADVELPPTPGAEKDSG